jgi:hypothetical protein
VASVAPIVEELRRVRGRARALLLVGALASILAGVVAAVLVVGVVDYLVRLPAWLRVVVWIVGAVGVGVAMWRLVGPAAAFRPSLTEVALRLERSEAGRKAGLEGVLASGLELAEDRQLAASPAGGVGSWMAARVVEEASLRFAGARAAISGVGGGSILSMRRMRDSLVAAGVCVAASVAVMALAGPTLSRIALLRVGAPWSGAQWPKRTMLAETTELEVHPLGTTLPLRIAVVKTDRPRGETKVLARYRLSSAAGAGGGVLHRALLTAQGQDVELGDGVSGELYERLIEPAALAGSGIEASAETLILEYWFESQDDRTQARKVKLVRPPAIVSARATVSLPEYARGIGEAVFASAVHDMGAGVDQRAILGPVLAGSEVDLTVRLNKSVPAPPGEAAAREAWLSESLAGLPEGAEASFDGAAWRIRWTAAQSLRLPVRPGDEHGIRSNDEAIYSFDVVEDKPPSATVVEPREDEAVLATAKVNLTGEGRDDVGISKVELLYQGAKPTKGSLGAAPEAIGEPILLTERGFGGESAAASTVQASLSSTLDLAALEDLDLKPGDELWIFAAATDNFELAGLRHEPVRSSARKLRIIREEDLIEQVRSELASVRKVAMRLDEEQAELKKTVESELISSDDGRRQNAISQRTRQQAETVQRLQDRIERNQLDDEALEGLLADLDSLLSEAAEAAQRAAEQMEAATADQEQAELSQQESQQIQEAQEEVRDRLGQVAETLDRGEDTWVLSRTLQRLAQQQRELQARTQRAGEQTMGKRPEDLAPQERSELQEIAEQQQRLSDAAQRAIDQLEERAKQMENVDATEAEGMRRAAERGKQSQVPQKMQEAGRNVQENQTSTAESQQQEAADALEQMLQDMNEAQRNRDQALRRILANLLQSLDKLIAEQAAQIQNLEAAIAGDEFAGLDAPMIALNTNTLAVAAVARSDRATAPIADLIDRAARNQDRAIAALRAEPVDVEKAEQGEKESLRLLRLAHAEARKLDEQAKQREADRKKAELRKAYREALEEQVAIQGATEPMVGRAIDRRERLQIRALGERQETLRQALEEVRKQTAEIDDDQGAGVFRYAHERLDAATGIAGKKLRAGQADQAVARNQASAVRILQSLLEALDQRSPDDDEFREEEGSEGGGSGGGSGTPPLIPPLAELKLLRAMQQEAMDLTRQLDEAADAGAPPSPEELAGIGQFQRNLHQQADELIKKMQQQQPGVEPQEPGEPDGPGEPKDDPEPPSENPS